MSFGFSETEEGPYLETFPPIIKSTGGNREFTLYMREENLTNEVISGDVLITVTNSEGELTCADFEEMYINVKHLAPAPEVDWVPSNGGVNVMLWDICNQADANTITFNYPTQAFEAGLIEISKIDVTFTEEALGTYTFETQLVANETTIITGITDGDYIIKVTNADVTLDGLTVDGTGNNIKNGIWYYDASGEIKNSIVQGLERENLGTAIRIENSAVDVTNNLLKEFWRNGIFVRDVGSSEITLFGNEIICHSIDDVNGAYHGIEIGWGAKDVTIQENTIYDSVISTIGLLDWNWSSQGIVVWGSGVATMTSTANIIDNTVHHVMEGIHVGFQSLDGDTSYALISGNYVYDCLWGIGVVGDADADIEDNIVDMLDQNVIDFVAGSGECIWVGGSYSGSFVEDSTATITGNTLNNCDMGIDLYENADVTITGNDITNNDYGIKTNSSGSESWSQTVVANSNKIVGNLDYGADNTANTATFNATNNWWGTTDGSVIATIVSGNVDYSPWLGAEVETSPMAWYTNDNIQDAINVATAGDTINVAAGTYTENLTIDKELILTGAGYGNTIISVADGIAIEITSDNVEVSGFKITHSDIDEETDLGILLNTVNNCTIENNYIYLNSIGIEILDSGSNTINLNVIELNAAGIYFEGTTDEKGVVPAIPETENGPFYSLSKNNVITGNSIKNSFISPLGDSGFGVYLDAVCDSNTFENNEIINNGNEGIYSWKANSLTVTENTINNNKIGVHLMGSSFNTITGNTITGNNENGLYIRAGALSSTDNIIMNNTISGSDVGIYLKDSQDPGYIGIVNGNTINSNGIYDNTLGATTEGTPDGDIYSMESNYWGTTTGIDGLVSTNVDYSPWYVDAEMTTLSDVKAITAFTISEQVGTTAIDENAHAIDLIMPYGTDVTALVATFTTTGESVKVDTDTQTSETTANDFTDPVTYTVTAIDITTQDYIVTVTVLTDSQTAPDDSGEATVSSTTPEVVITNPDQGVNITIDSDTDNPTIDVSAFISDGVGTLPAIDITSLNANNTTVAISTSTTVTSADSTWNGVIAAPTITTVTLPETSGQTKTLSTAIEVGFTGAKLSFDKAVRLLLPGQAGKRAGYTRDGGTTFTEIADICGADDQATGDALASDGDCKIDATNDLDLVIWTKHFTSFATYTQVTTPPVNSGGAGGYVMLPQQTQTVAEEKVTTLAGEEKQVEVLGVELNYRETQLNKILEEAIIAYQGDVNLILNNVGHNRNMANELAGSNKYTTSLIKGSSLTLNQVYSLTNFIVYGTETTEKLGAGERAGVLNSYKTAFGKLPTTQSEWEDAIKIADGRWPSETNEKAVNSAKVEFKKVYLRDANMDNSNDNAAVTIMAYGLRSDARNLNSEKTAIKTFKAIYSYNPSSTVNWDVVRAIAYSNATR